MALLELEDVRVRFPPSRASASLSSEVDVLNVPSFQMEAGEEVVVYGPSGCGKSTLLNVIAGLLVPTAGSVRLVGHELRGLSEARRDTLRAETLGFVFQGFHLLGAYSALENVLLGMAFGPGPEVARARGLLTRLGLAERMEASPDRLSSGERQRVAVARALANRPRLVLADEPTGHLDPAGTQIALELLREGCREEGAALLLVSHDPAVIERFERRVELPALRARSASASGRAPLEPSEGSRP